MSDHDPTAAPTKGREAGARAMMDGQLWPGAFDKSAQYCGQNIEQQAWRDHATACLRAFAAAHGLDAEGLRRAAYFIQMHGDYRTSGRDYAVADLLSELSALLAEEQPR